MKKMYSLSANGSLSYGVPNVNNAMQRALSQSAAHSAFTQRLFNKPLVDVAKIIGSKPVITPFTQRLFNKPLVDVAKIIGSKPVITPEQKKAGLIISPMPFIPQQSVSALLQPEEIRFSQPETRYVDTTTTDTTTTKKWYQKPAVMIGLGAGTLLVLYLATKKK